MQAITTQKEDSFELVLQHLAAELREQGNTIAARKADELKTKYHSEELVLAFCGHFSAGKSSLMNWLCGHQVLPTSPVPTTANIASIRCGEPRALVHTQQGTDLEIGLDDLDDYCKNGGDYEAVELWDHIPLLGKHGVLLDTPGVDSTDAAHEAATYSALHRADVVFYVMDYNHVQSETNLSFARTLYERGKPLYLIVNQIDKHEEHELPFQEYQRSVKQAFSRRGIEPAGILYVSRMVPEHRYGQLEQLRKLIGALLEDHRPLVRYSLSQAAWELAEEHSKWLRQQNEQNEEDNDDAEMNGSDQESEQELPDLEQQLQLLRTEEQQLNDRLKQQREKWAWEIGRLVDQANLTPAELRDQAQLYLEGERPGFKKGLFASKEKTMQEREQRKQTFLQAYREQVAAHLDVHIRSLLRGWSMEYELWNEEQEQQLTTVLPAITEKDIASGAGKDIPVSGEYVLNYTRALREQTAARYRRAALEAVDLLLEQLEPSIQQKAAELQTQIEKVQTACDRLSARLKYQHQLAQQDTAVRQLLPVREHEVPEWLPQIDNGQVNQEVAEAPHSVHPVEQSKTTNQSEHAPDPMPLHLLKNDSETSTPAEPEDASASQNESGNMESTATAASSDRMQKLFATAMQLRTASEAIHGISGLGSQAAELQRRAEVMENGKFTLALFGAFSAGKSSFANVLLGASVLPVSPHPMTAAITQIMASESGRPHGTAVVYMKSSAEMQEDISGALRLLGLPDCTLEQDWSRAVKGLSPGRIHPSARAHYNFVLAAAAGWEQAKDQLGQEITVDMQQFRGYVSEEQQSCFVRRIDLYYDCELTAQGMVLVDTPGADSVNARHTGVTFEYMKSADALVFVTYYNHAFTAGDRQLLEQLGRVKGSLALNNMFFIVNAADLASSEEEKQQVVGRMEQELNGAGIREPHIYSLSSRRALHGHDEGFAAFRKHFMSFADETLAGLAVHAAHEEINRIREVVLSWQEAAQQGETYRAQRRQQLIAETESARQTVAAIAEAAPDRRVREESGELLFHVRQRLRLKTLEWIPEIFNPSQLNQDSADLKADFAACGRELQRRLAIELEQEVLATTLRMEQAARRLIVDRLQTYGREAEKQASGLRLSSFEPEDWQTPELPALWSAETFDWKAFWPLFRNPRNFFEQGGRDKLRNQLAADLDQKTAQSLDQQRDWLADYYIDGLNRRLQQITEELQRQIAEWAEGTEASLQMTDGPERWSKLASQLQNLQTIQAG